ncbi:hypothetical protein [Vagococcus intermedius]|uniref:Uncharacterized protein n=1 Tax=Vagococcus intermedius TaxID=2991418 RepID=A0AAF0CWW7_9ENTE|nr:hypothetical protein [Vagococcus intermedius]WEG74396.1 hypothetical protein OL234_10550 [Vagococcus intermedius]WEG76517.1 hypothetical protein OL235_10725 [Vagococcus intermedius]
METYQGFSIGEYIEVYKDNQSVCEGVLEEINIENIKINGSYGAVLIIDKTSKLRLMYVGHQLEFI